MILLEKIARKEKDCPYGYKIVSGKKVCLDRGYYGLGGLQRIVKIVKKAPKPSPPSDAGGPPQTGGQPSMGMQGGMTPSGD